MEATRLCPYCLQPLPGAAQSCPHCGKVFADRNPGGTLPVGTVRVRRKGSDGGQRGMKSIIYLTGSDQFPRVKIGVGAKPHPDYDLAAWVLSKFTKEEAPRIREAAAHAAQAACLIVEGQIDEAMNRFSK